MSAFTRTMDSNVNILANGANNPTSKAKEDIVAFRESEAFKVTMLDYTSESIIIMSSEGNVVEINPAAVAIFGYSRAESLGRSVAELYIPIHMRERHIEGIKNFLATGKGPFLCKRFETTAVKKDGSEISVEVVVKPVFFRGSYYFTSFLKDISKRIQIEEELNRFKMMLDFTVDGIFMFHPDTLKFIFVNRRAVEQVGYSREELMKLTPLDIEPEFDEAKYQKLVAPLRNGTKKSVQFQTLHLRKNGSSFPVENVLRLVTMDDGALQFVAITRDITAQNLANAELARLSKGLEHVVESVMITDPGGAIQYVNPAFEQASGFSRQEVLGQNPNRLKSGVQNDSFYSELWATIKQGKIWKGTFINTKKDGSHYEEEATIAPVFDQKGEIINFIAIKRDVTEDRKAELRLRQLQKMEAIGVLSGGIAHDFNNILTPILGFCEILKKRLSQDDKAQTYLDAIDRAAKRARDLVSRILTFSRQTKGTQAPVHLDSLLKEVSKLLRSALPITIDIQTEISAGLPLVSADLTQLHSVMMNLCTNAGHAMPKGGTLTAGLDSCVLKDHELSSGQKISGNYVRLLVSDTGTGMNDETKARVFEPFFTTKPVDKGTGLGLSMVFGIVQQHKGHISVTTEPGRGTTFEIFLPAVQQVSLDSEVDAISVSNGGKESLLIVDDEMEIIVMVQEGLEPLGYQVTTHSDPKCALKFFRAHSENLDLLITDRTMPGMTGEQLIKKVRHIRPGFRSILCTGNADKLNKKRIAQLGIQAVLSKPYSPAQLNEVIRQVLNPVSRISSGPAPVDSNAPPSRSK